MVDNPQVVDEAQIISAIVRGETHLFHDLIRPHERSVYVMVLSLLQNEADAEDAAQEAVSQRLPRTFPSSGPNRSSAPG